MQNSTYLVIGAGIAGLSFAFHSRRADTTMLEAARSVGGLCRSHQRDGFLFDHTAHFLHVRDGRARALIDRLLPGAFAEHQRDAAIYLAGRYVPHPFQAHLGSLPSPLLDECLNDFLNAPFRRPETPVSVEPGNLLDWFRAEFGQGITRLFLEPHNRKTYCCELTELTATWAPSYVPQPSVQEVLAGALADYRNSRIGYNSTFLYPHQGGMDILPRALARHTPNIRCGERVVSVDANRRVVTCASGRSYGYGTLVSTMPLDQLLRTTTGLPTSVAGVATRLRAADVVDIQLGISRAPTVPHHWVYFPEPEFPFVRVVVPSNVSPTVAPAGMAALHIEANYPAAAAPDLDALAGRSVRSLQSIGFLPVGARVVSQRVFRIRRAYVLHDHFREQALPEVQGALRARGVYSIGRYGGWSYGGIESALLEGMELAAALAS